MAKARRPHRTSQCHWRRHARGRACNQSHGSSPRRRHHEARDVAVAVFLFMAECLAIDWWPANCAHIVIAVDQGQRPKQTCSVRNCLRARGRHNCEVPIQRDLDLIGGQDVVMKEVDKGAMRGVGLQGKGVPVGALDHLLRPKPHVHPRAGVPHALQSNLLEPPHLRERCRPLVAPHPGLCKVEGAHIVVLGPPQGRDLGDPAGAVQVHEPPHGEEGLHGGPALEAQLPTVQRVGVALDALPTGDGVGPDEVGRALWRGPLLYGVHRVRRRDLRRELLRPGLQAVRLQNLWAHVPVEPRPLKFLGHRGQVELI
mmetsp:Transcript_111388/g.311316  ORF Transcript_111388/g.311316 Transcript_111388/m.311316 type:complete len:313 (-) Transcript_111388:505-1443(-)